MYHRPMCMYIEAGFFYVSKSERVANLVNLILENSNFCPINTCASKIFPLATAFIFLASDVTKVLISFFLLFLSMDHFSKD